MRYITDHDLHIHTQLSSCSRDPEQTVENILAYGKDNGFTTLCLTDHMWDSAVPSPSDWYRPQSLEHIREVLPLPESEEITCLFGCETELDKNCTLGISREAIDTLDFVIIPTTHLHMNGFTCRGDEGIEERAALWCSRLEAVLNMDLPFHKIGIAHLTCHLMMKDHTIELLNSIPDAEYRRLFARAAKLGVGIELNFSSIGRNEADLEAELRPFRIAKEEGCKFYFGRDAHHPKDFLQAKENFEHIVDLLALEESDKFHLSAEK